MVTRDSSTVSNGVNVNDTNGHLHASISTGSTPDRFIPPPDKPEYHPYRLRASKTENSGKDWQDELELETATMLASQQASPLRFLVLYGSLRKTSYSRLLAFEMSRLLERMGAEVRVFDPSWLPVKHDQEPVPEAVQELRNLSLWSDGHVWVSPEQHGQITAAFKNQIDWIPLSTGSVRPTQGRTLAIAQVNGGSQSFNTVNTLRILGRWMRMFTIPNQSSVPMAWKSFTTASEFDGNEDPALVNRMKPSSNRDRVVDVCEELVKVTCLMRGKDQLFSDRYSERKEKSEHGKLLTQAEKDKLQQEDATKKVSFNESQAKDYISDV
ncbi:arsenate resistance ArsH [Cystobasidium minutum MCA 4210]|uniref:arsenate resistance ArsH n=1 Tax=Cystobasidium minutum MCA 4210 TaxID=1397322 RepID=UPI0034CF0FAD|eukprot:jgi/Rhomi1/143167/e_gw1.3.139.1